MAFNPSPKVAAARDFANKFDKKMVIIFSVNDDLSIEYASYGANKNLCSTAKTIGDFLFKKVEEEYFE